MSTYLKYFLLNRTVIFLISFKINQNYVFFSILKGSIERLKMTKHYENQYKENMETLKKIGMTEAVCLVFICFHY